MNNFHEILINQLAKESCFVTDDGELKKFIIIDAAFNMNRKLIELLLEVPEIKQKFFTEISGHWVFDINLFVQYMENKNFLKDSYTRFRNKIGLNIGGKFLNQRNEVSLVWPFKDCILEGGQSRDDQKRPEIFFNEILAQQEIDQLTEPKVLCNWKRYTVDGEKSVTELKRENETIKENLIIKGNNLLALHSLLPQFEEKVKLIYIDPPYNTGGDSFQYNDSFNHSTWLTFMKNRLETARKLLRKDGALFIHIDDIEEAYLKILCDEVFGREKFINTIAVKSSTPSGTKTAHKDKTIIKQKDFILAYKKGDNINIKPQYTKREKWDTHYTQILNKSKDGYFLTSLIDELVDKKILSKKISIKELDIENKQFKKFYIENADRIVRLQSHKNKTVEKLSRELVDTVYIDKSEDDKEIGLYYNGQVITPLRQSIKKVYANQSFIDDVGMLLCDFWDDIDFQNTQNEGSTSFPAGKKPEILLYRIIDMITNENDIVLDYHLGSGTTCAVSHKMKRQYIGIEQLDYGKNDSAIRLQNVIGKKIQETGEMFDKVQFDQSGISKAVNWHGGGEFVYCELKKYNQTFLEQIEEAETSEQLLMIWEEMKVHSFLNYNVDIKKQDENIEEFKQLSIETKKQHLCEILNKNQLYVNLSSIDDEDFQVSEDDKILTRDFYEIKEEKEVVQTKADL